MGTYLQWGNYRSRPGWGGRLEKQPQYVKKQDGQGGPRRNSDDPGDNDIPDGVEIDGADTAGEADTEYRAHQGVGSGDGQSEL